MDKQPELEPIAGIKRASEYNARLMMCRAFENLMDASHIPCAAPRFSQSGHPFVRRGARAPIDDLVKSRDYSPNGKNR